MAKTKDEEVKKGESAEKVEYRKMLEIYAKQNPAKYEAKKDRLLAKLELL